MNDRSEKTSLKFAAKSFLMIDRVYIRLMKYFVNEVDSVIE